MSAKEKAVFGDKRVVKNKGEKQSNKMNLKRAVEMSYEEVIPNKMLVQM